MDIRAIGKNRNIDFGKISSSFKQDEKTEQKSFKDDRFWKLDRDKAGNGSAIIRFLPTVKGDKSPFMQQYDHAFQGPSGRWYIEKSLSTISQKDPLGELNSRLWNTGLESDKDLARKQKRRLSYISNILIISDPAHPENDGQVKLFKIGKKIYDMIQDKLNLEKTFTEEQICVWDLFQGANFRIRIRQLNDWPSYDKSEFDVVSMIFGEDYRLAEKEFVETPNPDDMYLKRQYPLSEFMDPANFKTYEELSRKLAEVLDINNISTPSASSLSEKVSNMQSPKMKSIDAPTPKLAVEDDDDDDDVLNYFKKIANSN